MYNALNTERKKVMGNNIESMSNPGTISENTDDWGKAHHQNLTRHTVTENSKKRTASEEEEEHEELLNEMQRQELLTTLALNLNLVGEGWVAQRLEGKMNQFSTLYGWSGNGFKPGTGQLHGKLSRSAEELIEEELEKARKLALEEAEKLELEKET
ncbi:MAG: hypothetical protein DHS20C02_17390 [Micavibrio sp.]|nr:MAG: hypothetical protein DHS20C02_17390 [Micavibrio sp.]